jgi:hypothetical protein
MDLSSQIGRVMKGTGSRDPCDHLAYRYTEHVKVKPQWHRLYQKGNGYGLRLMQLHCPFQA